ncbi:MAG: hypothetical protein ACI9LM_001737 [Alteromonadaceae bacterium]|jgi:uncharacterized protein YnzC (UPF0291/DUF896 family)
MTKDEFDRLNFLSEKSLNETATEPELKEFSQLLDAWNNSVELNLFGGFYKEDY